jgi:hypothetical protein
MECMPQQDLPPDRDFICRQPCTQLRASRRDEHRVVAVRAWRVLLEVDQVGAPVRETLAGISPCRT